MLSYHELSKLYKLYVNIKMNLYLIFIYSNARLSTSSLVVIVHSLTDCYVSAYFLTSCACAVTEFLHLLLHLFD